MRRLSFRAEGAHGCEACGGAWLDNLTCQVIATSRLPLSITEVFGAAPESRMALTVDHPFRSAGVRHPRCPECRRDLMPSEVMGVRLDVCDEHGTWFDPGELRTLMQRVDFHNAHVDDKARAAELAERYAEIARNSPTAYTGDSPRTAEEEAAVAIFGALARAAR